MVNFLALSALIPDKKSSVEFLQLRGLLHNPRICANCHNGMKICLRPTGNGDQWRCSKSGCKIDIGLRKDTWFEGCRLEFRKITLFIYSWTEEWSSVKFVTQQIGVKRAAVVDLSCS